jgi:nucleoside-diphosphate-sugar epimerase
MKSGSALIFKSLRRFMFPIIGNGHNHVNMVYIKNLVDGIYTCTQNVDEGVELFYISDDHPYLMSYFVKVVKEEWGSNTRLLRIPKIVVYPFAMLMDWISNLIGKNIGFNTEIVIGMATNNYVFSIDKAKEFGYTPPFDLKEAVHHTCQWIEEQSQLE